MENVDKKQCEHCAHMNMCGGCCGGRHHIVKIAIKLIIIAIVFMCGFKLGSIHNHFEGGRDYRGGARGNFRMMGERYNWNDVAPKTATTTEVKK